MTEHRSEGTGIDPLARAIGGIEASLEMIKKTLSEDRIAAASYRTDVRQELHVMSDTMAEYSGDLREVKRDISDIMPKVVSLEQRALMSKGAANFAVVLGKGANAMWLVIGGAILYLLQKWLGKSP